MLGPAKSMRKKSPDLAPSAFETEGRGRHDNPAAGRRRDDERPRSEIDQNSFVLGRDIRLAESGIAASLGVHMDRPREEDPAAPLTLLFQP